MTNVDETRLLADLLALADSYEAKARHFREVAEMLKDSPNTIERPKNTPRKSREPAGRFVGIPSEAYIEVMRQHPGKVWDAPKMLRALRAAGHAEANVESARTMLYRLERKGQITKVDRGMWRMPVSTGGPSLSLAAQPES